MLEVSWHVWAKVIRRWVMQVEDAVGRLLHVFDLPFLASQQPGARPSHFQIPPPTAFGGGFRHSVFSIEQAREIRASTDDHELDGRWPSDRVTVSIRLMNVSRAR